MRIPLGSSRDLVKELPWVGVTAAGFLATFAFEHFVVHELIVLPEQAATGQAQPWAVASMVLPELVVCFAVGYRLRTALAVAMHAGVGGLLRGGFHFALALTRQPGHTEARLAPASELIVATPLMALAYLLVLVLAAAAAADQRQSVGGG